MATVLTTHRIILIPEAAQFYAQQAGALQTFHNAFSSWNLVVTERVMSDDPNYGTVPMLRHDIFLSSAQGNFAY